jgi:hypothetical protein
LLLLLHRRTDGIKVTASVAAERLANTPGVSKWPKCNGQCLNGACVLSTDTECCYIKSKHGHYPPDNSQNNTVGNVTADILKYGYKHHKGSKKWFCLPN